MEKTTIQINKETLERLKMLRRYKRESYDEVLNWLVDEVGEDSLDEEEIESIKKGLDDIRKGRVYSIEDVAKDLGVSLK